MQEKIGYASMSIGEEKLEIAKKTKLESQKPKVA
jgi:hypothetical protein